MVFNELNWIEFLKKKVPQGRGVYTAIGDDCALVKAPSQKLLLKSDLFIEDVHFKIKKTAFKVIGKRAVGRVLSDFAACAGVPKFLGVSLGLPGYLSKKSLSLMLEGILEYCRKYHFSLVAGDTSRSKKLFLDVWGVGTAKKCMLRSTAKTGDYIFLSGKLGQHSLTSAFVPRIKEAQYLVKSFKINAMIDISDGFILDLSRLLALSQKGALIFEKNIPLVNGPLDLYRGEDYELIFTVDKNEEKINLLKKKFYLVGEIKAQKFGYRIKRKNRLYSIKPRGYTHF